MTFMQFWFMANQLLKERAQAEMLYKEARELWQIYREKNWALA